MSVTLVGTTPGDQGLFNRLGALGYLLNLINAFRGGSSADQLPTEVLDTIALYDGDTETQRASIVGMLNALTDGQDGLDGITSSIQSAAQATLVAMCDADQPLSALDVPTALAALLRQMAIATTTHVAANTVSASVTQTDLAGDGLIVVSTLDGLGRNLENLLAETIRITVTDSTAGAEQLQLSGPRAAIDKLSAAWPAGSGAAVSLSCVASGGASDLLVNGNFETFTVANVPDGWTIDTGTAGTNVAEESPGYDGGNCVSFAGGATLIQLSQPLTSLVSLTPYAVALCAYVTAVPAAGELTLDLVDGNGDAIVDATGNSNALVVDLTALTAATWTPATAVFRLADPLPATVTLRARLSVALTAGKSLYLDNLALQPMTQLDPGNPGGTPFVAAFSGGAAFALGDGQPGTTFTIVTANDRASAWQVMFDRLFDTATSGVVLPVAGTTLINDSLIS